MKRKMTMKMPDGNTIIHEMDDEGAAMHKNVLAAQRQGEPPAKKYLDKVASKGQGGDTELAHVNSYEAQLLKMMGGAGTVNPSTGLKEYYVRPRTAPVSNSAPILPYSPPPVAQPAPITYPGVYPTQSAPVSNSAPVTNPVPIPITSDAIANQAPTVQPVSTGIPQAPPPASLGFNPDGSLRTNPVTTVGGTPSYEELLKSATGPTANNPTPNVTTMTPTGDTSTPGGYYTPNATEDPIYNVPGAVGYTPSQAPAPVASPTSTVTTQPAATATQAPATTQPVATTQPAVTTAQPAADPGTFNLDPNLKPFSVSASNSQSGLPNQYRDQLLSSLMPQLQDSVTNMGANYDKYTNEALGSYQQMMQNALRKNIPSSIAGMANRGIINSTEGNKILSDTYSNAAIDASNKGYTTAMQSAIGKAGMPSILAQIAQLGNGSNSNSFSYQEDPTVMARAMADLISGMM